MSYEICDTDKAAAWWTCEDCKFDRLVSYNELADIGNPICPLCDDLMRLADPDTISRHKVVIYVRGGIAEVATYPPGIDVEIIDFDNLEEEAAEKAVHRRQP